MDRSPMTLQCINPDGIPTPLTYSHVQNRVAMRGRVPLLMIVLLKRVVDEIGQPGARQRYSLFGDHLRLRLVSGIGGERPRTNANRACVYGLFRNLKTLLDPLGFIADGRKSRVGVR